MNLSSLLQMVLLLMQVVCHTLLPFSVLEEQKEGITIGTLSRLYSPPYQLLGNSYFRVNKETGDLYTTEHKLDREALCLSQKDGHCTISENALVGPEQDVVKITIVVDDINDNAPYFDVSEINLKIPEDVAVGARVLLDFKAQDDDVGSNGEISYHLAGAAGFFSVAQEGTALMLTVEIGLDREAQNVHHMLLIAVDSGSVPLSATASLVITVMDIDDHCAQFSPDNPRNVTVPGGAVQGTTVAQLLATDQDLGDNAQITYSFSPQISDQAKILFHLDSTTGRISLAINVSLDSPEKHVLRVVANSPHCPAAQAQVTVYMQTVPSQETVIEIKFVVEDQNQTIVLRENEPPTLLAILRLRDTPNFQGVMSLETDDTAFTLKIQANNYLLSTLKPLDYELCSDYHVTVVVSEAKGSRVWARKVIKVAVEDVNDNAPQFDQSHYHVEIEENNKPGIFLIQVRATDVDSQVYGKVSYSVIHESTFIFNINETTGVMSVAEPLDREQQGAYVLTVLARDHGTPSLEALVSVSVTVLDQNDNQPTFLPPRFIFIVSESIARLAQVGKIEVEDADKGANGTVAHVWVLNEHVPFTVDKEHLALRCMDDLDREKQDRYELLLQAVDAGSPRRSSTSTVIVIVEDINDNQPQIIFPTSNDSCYTVSPSTKAGSTITKIYAVDHDLGVNSDITYQIVASKPASPFQIDPHSGNIKLARQLAGSDYGTHHLFIQVSDKGKPTPLQATVWVNLLVNERLEKCNITSIPDYLFNTLKTSQTPDPETYKDCLGEAWLFVLCGFGLVVLSVCMLLVTTVICVRQRNLAQKRVSSREHELKPLN